MKYMIQAMVSGDRLPAVVEALFADVNYDPELKVYWRPDGQPTKERRVIVPVPVEKPKRRSPAPSGRRAELLEAALKTGPKRWSEMKTALSAGGLSESSLNNMIGNWKKEGRIRRSDDGLWSLVENAKAAHA